MRERKNIHKKCSTDERIRCLKLLKKFTNELSERAFYTSSHPESLGDVILPNDECLECLAESDKYLEKIRRTYFGEPTE